jgi:hypothetical protein
MPEKRKSASIEILRELKPVDIHKKGKRGSEESEIVDAYGKGNRRACK